MSSSDSEDDCYGNVAQKLQKMKNRYQDDKLDSTNLLNDSSEIDNIVKYATTNNKSPEKVSADIPSGSKSADSDFPADITVATATTTSRRKTRSSTRNSVSPSVTVTEEAAPPSTRGRGRGRASPGRRPASRGRRGWRQTSITSISQDITSPPPQPRTPRRGRGSRRRASNIFDSVEATYPIYSIGNTHEYPDQSESQQLFSSKPPVTDNDVVLVLEENDPLDDNEELSVKVYWQSSEFFKFTIRRYQKLTQIFDYFANKENVEFDKLLFTFNEKILNPDDTPDSIDYNIVKFIDGGVVNKSVSQLAKKDSLDTIKDGIKIKFQCQNMKKPFETLVRLDDKLSVAMLKCAEHFEKTLDKLRFIFDGESLSGKSTARELDFEGDECIDVKILS